MSAQLVKRHEASYWISKEGAKVECQLCPHHCVLRDGKIGICKGKENSGGTLYATNYGETTAIAIDPIEKKPLYHFYPGRNILSVGPNGCNLACTFCQNYQISQEETRTSTVSPEGLANMAKREGNIGVAYTYTEPLIWFEFVRDAAINIREAGMVNVLVTNGLINEKPFQELAPLIDAMNIDIKSMDQNFYKKTCRGPIEPVLKTVEMAFEAGIHVEITNLVIPGLNDTDEAFDKLTDFIARLAKSIPLHFSKYHPDFKLSSPATPPSTLERAALIASEKLDFVYVGNIALDQWQNTNCPECGEIAIRRDWFDIAYKSFAKDGHCNRCGHDLNITVNADENAGE